MPSRQRVVRAIAIGVLVLHTALLLGSMRRNYVCTDESGHIPSGLSHWQTGTFWAYRANPPLPRMLAALPLWAAGPNTAYADLRPNPNERCEWPLARAFSAANKGRYFDLVCLARLPGIAWSLLGAGVIFRWARELYGETAGCLGLTMWCLGPNVLAYAALAVPDVPTTVAGLLATYLFRHFLLRPSWGRAWVTGFLLGVALLTRFTWLMLFGLWPLLALPYLWRLWHDPIRRPRGLVLAGQAALIPLLGLFVLNAGYGFQETGRTLGELSFVSRTYAGQRTSAVTGNKFADHWLGSVVLPVPAQYVMGIDTLQRDLDAGWSSYLRGEWRRPGWWYYYLYALAIKVPLGTWGLVLWALVLTLIRHRSGADWVEEWTLWLPVLAILTAVSSQTGFNHHMRYVMPAFPFAIISTAKLGYFLRPERWRAGLAVLVLLLGSVVSGLSVYPHFLSYFNEAAGGPDRGSEHLIDSNIDWGQDLLALKAWLNEHPEARPLNLAYYNFVDAGVEGIAYQRPPIGWRTSNRQDLRKVGPQAGYFAIDVNFVRGAAFFAYDGKGGYAFMPGGAYAYFQSFRPIAKAGYSIFIYHISREEANRVRGEMNLPPLPESPPGPF